MEFLSYFSNVFTFTNLLILFLGTVGGLLMGAAPGLSIAEKIEAGIVLKKNHKVTENDLIKHCENLIGKFKSPDKVYFFSELPKGPSGKIQRFKIQEKIK